MTHALTTTRSTDPRRFQPMSLAGPILCFIVGLALTVAGISGADQKLASDASPAEPPITAAPETTQNLSPAAGETVLLPVSDWAADVWPRKVDRPALFQMKEVERCELAEGEVELEEAFEDLRLELRAMKRIVVAPTEGA